MAVVVEDGVQYRWRPSLASPGVRPVESQGSLYIQQLHLAVGLGWRSGQNTATEFGQSSGLFGVVGFAIQSCRAIELISVYYGAQIFGGVGIGDPLVVQLIIGAVNVVCTFPGLYFAERFGRRMPLFYGAVWQTGWLLIFAIMGTVLDPLENRGAGIAMIVSACMFIASFARYVYIPIICPLSLIGVALIGTCG